MLCKEHPVNASSILGNIRSDYQIFVCGGGSGGGGSGGSCLRAKEMRRRRRQCDIQRKESKKYKLHQERHCRIFLCVVVVVVVVVVRVVLLLLLSVCRDPLKSTGRQDIFHQR